MAVRFGVAASINRLGFFLFFASLLGGLATFQFSAKAAEGGATVNVGGVSFQCAGPTIEMVDRNYPKGRDYNQELAANAFAVFAAASYDAYEPRKDGRSRAFRI